MKFNDEYSISFDIGTNSVGWAVVDKNANLLKFKKRNMWGVRLFQEGDTAKARRLIRCQRRRYVRMKNRIDLLQELMGPMVLKQDVNFFKKMNESFIQKNPGEKNLPLFFNDEDFKDKTYYEKYPTIYHLKMDLIAKDEKFDPRLIYLALHHIVKYRGNFLTQGSSYNFEGTEMISDLEILIENINEMRACEDDIVGELQTLAEISLDTSLRRARKKEELKDALTAEDKDSKKIITEIVNAILGYKFNLKNLFENENYTDDSGKAISLVISQEDLEQSVEGILSETELEILVKIKDIYSNIALQEILAGNNYLSEAMINKYEKHKKELRELNLNYS